MAPLRIPFKLYNFLDIKWRFFHTLSVLCCRRNLTKPTRKIQLLFCARGHVSNVEKKGLGNHSLCPYMLEIFKETFIRIPKSLKTKLEGINMLGHSSTLILLIACEL